MRPGARPRALLRLRLDSQTVHSQQQASEASVQRSMNELANQLVSFACGSLSGWLSRLVNVFGSSTIGY